MSSIYLIYYLASNVERYSYIVNSCIIYVVPSVNPDGIDVALINPYLRKNLRPVDDDGDGLIDEDPPNDVNGNGFIDDYDLKHGVDDDGDGLIDEDWPGGVDLNRNYDYMWGKPGSSRNPKSETYCGPYPFSEPETRAVKEFVEKHNIRISISLHSGIEAILFPWGYKSEKVNDNEVTSIAYNLSKITGWISMQISNLYPVSGCFEDWIYSNYGVPSFTCEIYGSKSENIFYFFNPPTNQILTVAEKVVRIVAYIANYTLTKTYTVNLHVEDQLGRRLNNSIVSLRGEGLELVKAAEDGAVLFRVKRGLYNLTINWLNKNIYNGQISIKADCNETVKCRVYDGFLNILDGNNRPVEEALVSIDGEIYPLIRGRVEVSMIPEGKYTVCIYMNGASIGRETILIDKIFNFTLKTEIYDLILDFKDLEGNSLDAEVLIQSNSLFMKSKARDGVLKVGKLPIGSYNITAYWMGRKVSSICLMHVNNTRATIKCNVSDVKIYVEDISSKPVNTTVILKGEGLTMIREANNGVAFFPKIPIGIYIAEVKYWNKTILTTTVNSEVNTIKCMLKDLKVKVKNEIGNPVENCLVIINYNSTNIVDKTSKNGEVLFNQVPRPIKIIINHGKHSKSLTINSEDKIEVVIPSEELNITPIIFTILIITIIVAYLKIIWKNRQFL
jgi:hypothetical protein